jgi:hypothetical protein
VAAQPWLSTHEKSALAKHIEALCIQVHNEAVEKVAAAAYTSDRAAAIRSLKLPE